ncbi:hypothetical protein [Pelosinus baikalensis]|uniref:Phage tail collar domain-containing protein n=1 Tax=Pelosinus baikalensis TaxID=2892015 RepID=A0ABS8HMZ9_9FIRM|nr:hypothetical protein [Pelosinus baikalensis]MCC5464566.1 hypothetical protein [Pelosinus baikalensis]
MSKTVNCTEEVVVISEGKKDIGKLVELGNDGKFDPSVIPVIDDLQNQITKEVTARKEADEQLQANLDVEVLARTNADAKLQGNIEVEANARTAADQNLQDQISKEVADRTNANNTLQTSIDAEANSRAVADKDLQEQLTKEVVARTDGDTALQSNVDAEVTARTNADEAESSTRASADKSLQEEIDVLKSKNAFSNVVVNGTTIQADSQTDTIELKAGTNIELTADTENDEVTIGVTGKVASAASADTATACTGNAATATKLEAARTINDVAFDGTADIVITQINGKDIATVDQIPATPTSVPIGGIIMWSGSDIPTSWALCNGSNGTPDLRGKFVLGTSASYLIGQTGGQEMHTISIDEMPIHSHKNPYFDEIGFDVTNGGGGDPIKQRLAMGDNAPYNNYVWPSDVSNVGGNRPHNNMPPYYVLAYIMRTA